MGISRLVPSGRWTVILSLMRVMKLEWLANMEKGPVSLMAAKAVISPSKRVLSGLIILAENMNTL